MDKSSELFGRALGVLPGGVNSPVRAFRAVDMTPRFIARADGARVYDEDGREYIDYVCSWGPMILGHNHSVIREAVESAARDGLSFGAPTRREVIMAELMVGMVPNIEMVRMVNSGTEAVMSALAARVEEALRTGIDDMLFLRTRRAMFGARLRGLGNFSGLAVALAEGQFADYCPLDTPRMLAELEAADCVAFIRDVLAPERLALSVIRPA